MGYRLGPGEMLAVNVKEGKLYLNDEVKQAVVSKKPYAQLLKSSVTPIVKGSFKSGMYVCTARVSVYSAYSAYMYKSIQGPCMHVYLYVYIYRMYVCRIHILLCKYMLLACMYVC